MSYDPNIPQASDDPSVSQGEILQNFQTIGSNFGVNHVALGAVSNPGKHKFVEMPNQSVIPGSLISGEGTLYTKAVSTISQAFWTPDNSGNEYQMTRNIAADFASFGGVSNPGWTFLPGGLLLQYGFVATPGNSGTVNLPTAFTNATYAVTFGFERAAGSSEHAFWVRTGTRGTTSFSYNSDTSGSVNMFWMAIGN